MIKNWIEEIIGVQENGDLHFRMFDLVLCETREMNHPRKNFV